MNLTLRICHENFHIHFAFVELVVYFLYYFFSQIYETVFKESVSIDGQDWTEVDDDTTGTKANRNVSV